MKIRIILPLLVVMCGLFVSALAPRPTRVMGAPAPSSCEDNEAKAQLYKKFLDNFKGNPEQQKVAYETGRTFIARYSNCPDEDDKKVSAYIRKWVAAYEKALKEWQRRQP